MSFPTPNDPQQAPVWENYVSSQLAHACLGLIPIHALAIGVKIDGSRLRVIVRLSEIDGQDEEDIDDIKFELQASVGLDIDIEVVIEIVSEPDLASPGGVWWVYMARPDTWQTTEV